jgi:hypothetical protein
VAVVVFVFSYFNVFAAVANDAPAIVAGAVLLVLTTAAIAVAAVVSGASIFFLLT